MDLIPLRSRPHFEKALIWSIFRHMDLCGILRFSNGDLFPLPKGFKGITILDEADGIKAEMEVILSLIAEHDAVLATGHLSPEESLVLLKVAREIGVARMVVTHASESVTLMYRCTVP